LSRVIKTKSAGKDRTHLLQSVLKAIQELARQTEVDEKTQDLAAFITLSLETVWKTIDPSVDAWEKRGYWVKADRFRLEWEWTDRLSKKMRLALISEDWGIVALTTAQVGEQLKNLKPLKRPSKTEPWNGAWRSFHMGQGPK